MECVVWNTIVGGWVVEAFYEWVTEGRFHYRDRVPMKVLCNYCLDWLPGWVSERVEDMGTVDRQYIARLGTGHRSKQVGVKGIKEGGGGRGGTDSALGG